MNDHNEASSSEEPHKPTTGASIKDTIESILIAFILAFVFRAFVVEAFVIPTGSMAPTLLGAHARFNCPNCGYHFDVNYSLPPRRDDMEGHNGDDVNIPRVSDRSYNSFCPNCGFRMPREQAASTPIYYGDRILVLKYLYLFQKPQRWDVVVFKSPNDPEEFNYTQNYIKRLVGRPNETIMILDGDVYVGHGPNPTDWQIQTKSDVVQNALWRVIYNLDFFPQGIARDANSDLEGSQSKTWPIPWVPETTDSPWQLTRNTSGSYAFVLKNLTGSSSLSFDPLTNANKHAFTDWMGYDQFPDVPRPLNTCADIKLSFFYERTHGTGPLRLELSKRQDTFIAEIGTEKISLWKQTAGNTAPTLLQSQANHLGSAPAKIEFTNLDYQVTLRINGQVMLQTTREQYHPNVDQLKQEYLNKTQSPLPAIKIVGQNQVSTISHLSLWRDIYYTNTVSREDIKLWAAPDNPVVLGNDEYFVLGDNSPISGDARYWQDPINLPLENLHVQSGRIPGRFLLGKAFFVYWPAGFRPFSDSGTDIVPNFGDMRFIH